MVWFAVGTTPPAQPQAASPANAREYIRLFPPAKPVLAQTAGTPQPQEKLTKPVPADTGKKKQDAQKLPQPLPRYSHIFEPNSAEDRELTILCYWRLRCLLPLVGYGELISRYKDSPLFKLFTTFAASAYLLVNMGAGVMALDLIRIQQILATGDDWWLKQTLLAAFGAIAFFRTSLFTVRVGGIGCRNWPQCDVAIIAECQRPHGGSRPGGKPRPFG